MARFFIRLGLMLVMGFPLLSWGLLTNQIQGQELIVSAKITRQLSELVRSYQNREPEKFTEIARDLLNRTGKDDLIQINAELKKRKLPSIEEMVAKVRVDAVKSNVPLPLPSWKEFKGILPLVVQQISETTSQLQEHPLSTSEVAAPENFSDYEDLIWQLHVFRNQLNVLQKVANGTAELKKKYSRQLRKLLEELDEPAQKAYRYDVDAAKERLNKLVHFIDEREAEIRILRVDDANDLVLNGKSFADQFDAAFALAYDQLYFREFMELADREKRQFNNADLNDRSLFEIVNDLVEASRTKNPGLFEKATLFYVGSHWWLRGRYGQGPLANGLLKARQAAKNEAAQFPLFMPVQIPNVEQLIGQMPVKTVIRRHEYVWSLGNEGIESMSISPTKRSVVVAEMNQFY